MLHADFAHPVTVLVGLGMPRSIGSASEALAFLEECPAAHHDEAWQATTDLCRDAAAGRAGTNEVQAVFTAFADLHGLLLMDLLPETQANPSLAA